MKNIKIFEGENIKEVLQLMFSKGYVPATIEEVYQLRLEGKILMQGYVTGTLWTPGTFRRVTVKDDLKKIYKKGGRLLFLGDLGINGLGGGILLYGIGRRFVGVKQ